MNYKLSVIIPIFNAEKHLKKSIESIIQQSIGFENIELLLVDDKSTDNSSSIIQDYANNYKNIIPIYLNENSRNASTPRNIGIKNSTSDYLMFLDSDDTYEPELCEKFYKYIIDESADCVSCGYNLIDHIHSSKIDIPFNFQKQQEYEDKIIVKSENLIEFDNVYVWNKIFKKSIIIKNNIFFRESISEDFIFCIEYLLKSKKRIHIKNYYGYNKFLQEESLSIKEISLTSVYNHVNVDYEISALIDKHINNTHVKKIKNNVFKEPIKWVIEEFVTLSNTDDVKKGMKYLASFEKSIEFESSLTNIFLNIINNLILKEKWTLAIIIIKIGQMFLNSNITRKLYRIISN